MRGEVFTYNDKKYNKELLLKIGNNVASIWGGSCFDFEVINKSNIVIFHCVEHGEFFSLEIEYEKLDEYDY